MLDVGSDVSVFDPDSAVFDGGNLTIAYSSGQQAEDRLVINTGFVTLSAGQTAGSIVSVGGTPIGFLVGGRTGDTGEGLMVYFTNGATSANVASLLKAVQYGNAGGDNPTDGDRVLSVSVNDGDGGTSAAATVTVNVNPVNDDPAATGIPTSITVAEDTAGNVDLSGVTLSDPDLGLSRPLTITITADVGTLTATSGIVKAAAEPGALDQPGTLAIPSVGVVVSGSGTGTVSLSGTLFDINAYLANTGNIKYTGAANASGFAAARLTITANDNGYSGDGGGTTVTLGTIAVDITGVDDPATARNDSFSVSEASALTTGTLFADNGNGADTDIDSALTVTAVNGVAANVGTAIALASGALLTLNADGTFSYDPNGAFEDLPDFASSGAANTSRADSFTYQLNNDSTATVTITVNGVDSANDVLLGTAGSDHLAAGIGNDTITGGLGSDTIEGGAGLDTAVLRGLNGGGFDLVQVNGTVYGLDRVDHSFDTMTNVEQFQGDGQTIGLAQVESFDPLAYGASYNDLALAFRTDAGGLLSHYLNVGFSEGREVTFSAAQYLANYADLRDAFGTDGAAATAHFLNGGVQEHRLAQDPLDYIASYADLIAAFHGNGMQQLQALGLNHYAGAGYDEGRRGGIDFDAAQYLANYGDLTAAFGTDLDGATVHYINAGYFENRLGLGSPRLYRQL